MNKYCDDLELSYNCDNKEENINCNMSAKYKIWFYTRNISKPIIDLKLSKK